MPWNSFTGNMARRLLVNWRVPLNVAASALPHTPNLRPKSVNGYAVAGLCLVRLEHMHLAFLPSALGLSSENMAIRMGVEWDTPAGTRNAVIIFRRETQSTMTRLLAKHVGYGVHHQGDFHVSDDLQSIDIKATSQDDPHHAHISATSSARIMPNSVFNSVAQAQDYFRGGECGYSPSRRPGFWNGAKLHMHRWELTPLIIHTAHSTYLNDLFAGTAQIDSAFIMRNIPHTWSSCGTANLGTFTAPSAATQKSRAA